MRHKGVINETIDWTLCMVAGSLIQLTVLTSIYTVNHIIHYLLY